MKLLVVAALLLHILHSGTANPVYAPALKLEVGTVLGVDTSNCPPGYSQPANSNWTTCYKISDISLSKKSAAAQCSLNNGTLASVQTPLLILFFITLLLKTMLLIFGWELNASTETEVFVQTTMEALLPTIIFRLSNFDGSCVFMSMVGRVTQLWSSFDCGQRFQFACEAAALRQQPVLPTTTMTTVPATTESCPLNYKPFQSMCYNFVFVSSSNRISANNASTICKQVAGGRLSTIPNAQVNSFLVSIRPKSLTSYVAFDLICSNIQSNGDRSSCKWDDGTPFSYDAFSDANYPHPSTGTSAYGNGCCDFNNGRWGNCYNGDYITFDSYICQAPMH